MAELRGSVHLDAMLSPDDLDFQAELAGRYSLDRELGRGGMGIVYLAREALLDRAVAIKRLPTELADDKQARERFVREAKTAAQLFHPNIVPIHRVDDIGRFVFFAMGYVDGETVGQLVRRRGPLPVAEATRILRDAAWALGYGHARGVVHRDVKPDNLLVEKESGRTLVTDFGIAHKHGTTGLTQDGQMLGSVHYMSPEMVSGSDVDGRSDVYALGAVAHFLLTGRPPFDHKVPSAVLAMHLNQSAPPISSVAKGIPQRLAAAIDRCLAKDPGARFASADAFAEALADVEATKSVAAPLRAWVKGAGLIDPGLFFVGGITIAAIVPTQNFWLLAIPVVYATVQRLRATRRVVASGYDSTDLAAALLAEVERRSEESASHFEQQPPVFVKVLRTTAVVSLVIAVVLGSFYVWMGNNWAWVNHNVSERAGFMIINGFSFSLVVTLLNGFIAEAIAPSRVFDRIGGADLSWRLAFWRSKAGGWLAKVLRRGARTVAKADADRPTEVIVGSAAASLYDALPREVRKEFAQLPGVVSQLEIRARELRARRDLVPDDRVDTQLASTIAALETIRLDLLRLHAGRGSTADLTAALQAASQIGDDVAASLAGRAAVERLISGVHSP